MAFVRLPGGAVRPGQPSQEMLSVCGTQAGLCAACLSPFSDANVHANGLLSCLSGLCKTASSRKTMIIDSCVLVRSVGRHCYHWEDENYECALCRDRVQWDQDSRLTYDTSPDMHTVRSNRISSTQSIPSLFPLAVFFLILPSHSLSYLCKSMHWGDFPYRHSNKQWKHVG